MPDTHDFGRLLTHLVQLDPGAPRFHTAMTAEYNDPMRYSRSLVIRTGIHRRGQWFGIRLSWLSIQAKIPIGKREDGVWGIVLGWWRYPKGDDNWPQLLQAVQTGREPDERDAANFELPTRESIRGAVEQVDRRRVDAVTGPGADG